MKKVLSFAFVGGCVIVFTLGCTSSKRVAELSVISTRDISSLTNAQRMGSFEAKACGGRSSSLEEAIDRLLEMGKGNAIIDAVIYYDTTGCTAFLPYRGCYRVSGIVVRTREFTPSSFLDPTSEILGNRGYDTPKTTVRNGFTYMFIKSSKNTSHDIAGEERVDLVLRLR